MGASIQEADYRGVEPDRLLGRSLMWRLRQPLVPIVKRAARTYGTMTADRRCLPDYLVIGGKRTGSTTLARNLTAADDVLPLFPARSDRKGTYFFDVHYDNGTAWYRSHFVTERHRARLSARLGRPVVGGEASPYYLHHPHAPARAAALARHAKIICVVRDPVERAFSHYRERVRQGIEAIGSFEAAVQAEPSRLEGEWEHMVRDPSYVSLSHLNYGYLAQSTYAAAISRWIDAFGDRQVMVLRSSDLFEDPTARIAQVRRFLGLSGHTPTESQHFNQLPVGRPDAAFAAELRAGFADDQAALEDLLSTA